MKILYPSKYVKFVNGFAISLKRCFTFYETLSSQQRQLFKNSHLISIYIWIDKRIKKEILWIYILILIDISRIYCCFLFVYLYELIVIVDKQSKFQMALSLNGI